jgi:hypothetical protein
MPLHTYQCYYLIFPHFILPPTLLLQPHPTCDVSFPPRSTGRYRKGMISAPPVVGQEIGLGSRNLRPQPEHVPRGAPSRRSCWVICRLLSKPPCVRKGVPDGLTESGYSTRRHMLGPFAQRRCNAKGREKRPIQGQKRPHRDPQRWCNPTGRCAYRPSVTS